MIWYTCTAGVATYSILLVFYLLRRRRACYDIPEDAWEQFTNTGEILLGGYLFHYLPFFFYDRTLFLHHYLPAYVYKMMLTAFVASHLPIILCSGKSKPVLTVLGGSLFLLWMGAVIQYFYEFSALSYGLYPLTAEEVKSLKWKDTWDLIIHKS